MIGSSVAVARYLGPHKLGYFTYINLFVGVITRTSGTGLASATRKYMSEFLALDQPGMARAVYHLAHRYQLISALLITAIGLLAIAFFGDHGFRLMAAILIVSILPGIMSWVPAQANNAFEEPSRNTLSAGGYIFAYLVCILLTVHFHWDLVGVASAILIGRTTEVMLRTVPLHRRLQAFPLTALDNTVKIRIRNYCAQAFGIQLLMSIVWDRSEILFLRAFSSLEQIAFYSVSFGLSGNLLLLPRTFGGATGLTLMVEASRDRERVESIVRNACRFLLLVALPVHLGAAAIAREAVRFVYGAKYAGAVPVMMVAAILAIPRAFQEIPETLIRTADKQQKLLVWFVISGVVNIGLDFLLIPRFGAVGAAWGNGLAQTFGIAAIWLQARTLYEFRFPWGTAMRLSVAASVAAGVAWAISRSFTGAVGLAAAIISASFVYLVLLKVLRGLQPSDRARLRLISDRLPGPFQRAASAAINFAVPATRA